MVSAALTSGRHKSARRGSQQPWDSSIKGSVLSLLWMTAKIPAMFVVFDKEMTKLTNKEFVVLALKEVFSFTHKTFTVCLAFSHALPMPLKLLPYYSYQTGGEDELLPLKSLLARSVFQIRVTLYNFTPNHRTFSVSTITEDLIIDNQADVAAENILPSSEGARGLTASSSGVAVVGKKGVDVLFFTPSCVCQIVLTSRLSVYPLICYASFIFKHLINPKMETKMVSKAKRLHFILMPLMAQGHLIPMVDISKILAEQGNIITIVSTPQNASRFAKTVERAKSESGFQINVVTFPIAYKEFGLPENCETLDTLPSKDLLRKFYDAVDKIQEPLERFLEEQETPPSCIISDKCLFWTSKTAKRFKIPRVVFHGMCCFSLLSSHNVHLHSPHLSVSSDSEPFSIPEMPHKVEIAGSQLPGAFRKLENMDDVREKMRESESEAFGVIVNSFHKLEPGYAEAYAKAIKKKVWFIGPVSLCNDRMVDLFDRGNNCNIAISETECLKFLDSMRPKSVLYVCLGSLCRLIPNQLIELGLALEVSGKPFIWVIKTEEKHMNMLNEWLKRGRFEERIRGRGIVIKGWSPQAMILSHGSTGGFLTHCGWNSVIEGVSFGVPMITWPMFAEQFLNEKFVVEVLKVGVRVGAEIPVRWGDEERVGVSVKKHSVVKAIKLLMDEDGNEDGEFLGRRIRVQELAVKAREAVEMKGSSSTNVSLFIQDVLEKLSLE
ncbi:hypothetical protein Bca101_093602 [Brassica carinata]